MTTPDVECELQPSVECSRRDDRHAEEHLGMVKPAVRAQWPAKTPGLTGVKSNRFGVARQGLRPKLKAGT